MFDNDVFKALGDQIKNLMAGKERVCNCCKGKVTIGVSKTFKNGKTIEEKGYTCWTQECEFYMEYTETIVLEAEEVEKRKAIQVASSRLGYVQDLGESESDYVFRTIWKIRGGKNPHSCFACREELKSKTRGMKMGRKHTRNSTVIVCEDCFTQYGFKEKKLN